MKLQFGGPSEARWMTKPSGWEIVGRACLTSIKRPFEFVGIGRIFAHFKFVVEVGP
jgi:hypothetical protein